MGRTDDWGGLEARQKPPNLSTLYPSGLGGVGVIGEYILCRLDIPRRRTWEIIGPDSHNSISIIMPVAAMSDAIGSVWVGLHVPRDKEGPKGDSARLSLRVRDVALTQRLK